MRLPSALVAASFVLGACTSKRESEFIAGCTSTGVPKSACSCTYDKIEDKLKVVEKDPNYMRTEEFLKAYAQAVRACN